MGMAQVTKYGTSYSQRRLSCISCQYSSKGNVWEKFKVMYLLSAWEHRSTFFLNNFGILRASRQYKFFCNALFITELLTIKDQQGEREVSRDISVI